MTETTERFLQEIAARVGYDRVAELYLFPVLRQGGVEGAVAVVAAHPEPVEGAEPEAAAPEAQPASEPTPEVEVDAATPVGESDALDEGAAGEAAADEASVEAAAADEASADETVREPADVQGEPAASDEAAEAPVVHPERARHVVYTARYRHTIKGTDRGRWVVEVVAEADAPLITVEEVVRGVVRRSGDAFQPERISGDQFRAIVPAPADRGSAPA